MSRQTRRQWASFHRAVGAPNMPTWAWSGRPSSRRLRFESLEYRRLLSITVDTLLDVDADDGLTTLREAIAAAPSGETINFSVIGTINLSSLGQLTIDRSLTINGPGAELLTIDASGNDPTPASNIGDGSRVFIINDGDNGIFSDIAIRGLTLTGGDVTGSGGAISNRENLTLDHTAISGNHATQAGGGIVHGAFFISSQSLGGLTVMNSTISGNSANDGGGISSGNYFVGHQTTILSSTISGNSAGDRGGGVYLTGGNFTVLDSTISGNLAGTRGGGVVSRITDSLNPAEYRTTISNSTISGNSAGESGGAVFSSRGLTVIRHSTITGNTAPATKGSGLASYAAVSVRTEVDSSIVAGNTNSDIDTFSAPSTSFVSLGYNVTGTGNAIGQFNQATDQTGVSAASLMLGALTNNGGPTLTHALLAGSPAINAGDPSAMAGVGDVPQDDQRGAPESRVVGGQIDVGAFEFNDFTTFTVTTLADENNGIFLGGVSLREAIVAANSSAGSPLIQFDASLAGAMTLGSQLPTITQSLLIVGLGAEVLTIQAFDPTPEIRNGDGSRVFTIDDGNAATRINVSIGGLTITGGDIAGNGGAVRNVENLTLIDSVISGNAATNVGGGLYNSGASSVMTLRGVAVRDNRAGGGGGVFSQQGTLAVISSTIRDNVSTVNGGGIQNNFGRLIVANSTISGNDGGADGGGILSFYDVSTMVSGSTISGNQAGTGGGIWIHTSNMNVTSSTVSGNSSRSSGGGIHILTSSLTLKHSTVASNVVDSDNNGTGRGGGIFASGAGTISLEHIIVAGNIRGVSGRDDIFGAVAAQYSLVGDNDGATIANNGGNAIGTAATPIDPLLGPLADNGGPTLTHELLFGSLAINSGNPAVSSVSTGAPQFDQRADPFERVFGGRIDVGALEFRSPLPPQMLVVDSLSDVLDGNYSTGNLSLREAIKLANDNFGVTDVITFATGLHGGAINLSSLGELTVADSVSIEGLGANRLTINAYDPTPGTKNGDGSRVFKVSYNFGLSMRDVTISGLTLTGGDVTGSGGAIENRENLTLSQVAISGNHATTHGGGVYRVGGQLTVSNSTISGNSAGDRGGAIFSPFVLTRNQTTISNSTISGNSANQGGGIFHDLDDLTVSNSTISGNSASRGGGIFLYGSDLTVLNSTISGNSAIVSGGGIHNLEGLAVIRRSTITGNTAPAAKGSGVATSYFAQTEVDSSIIAGNANSDVDFDDVNFPGISAFVSLGYNLIGTGSATGAFTPTSQDQVGADPMLGPLADNSGPTQTHVLLVGSPAIDMGDPAISFNSSEFDQRGGPFARVFDGGGGTRIDVGAYERQTLDASNFIVDTLVDENDGGYSPGNRSLREALGLSHGSIGAETITFDAALAGGAIVLTLGELAIRDAMTINGLGAELLTIDAAGNDPTPASNNGDGSRIFHVDDGDNGVLIDVGIAGLTLTGGDVQGGGGGIANRENLTVSDSVISGNSAGGLFNYGGGIRNYFQGNLTIAGSTISGNSSRTGGGIASFGNVTLVDSTISGNLASSEGGGIDNRGDLSGDRTTRIINSTISGNTAGFGGGIANTGLVLISHSTITNNTAGAGYGSGIASDSDPAVTRTEVGNTIIAGNVNSDVDFVFDAANTFQSNGHNLIGAGNALGVFNQTGDQTGVADPMLDALGDNGGLTMTHALLPGSPAIDAGDPIAVAGGGGVPPFDQRGAPLVRVANGDGAGGARIDVGAFELQSTAASADFDDDDDVDGADFLVWQRGLGTTVGATRAQGNADGDGDVDAVDLGCWTAQFGGPPPVVALMAPTAERSSRTAAVDAILYAGDLAALFAPTDAEDSWHGPWWRRRRGR